MRYLCVFALLLPFTFTATGQITMELDSPTTVSRIFAPMIVSTQLRERDIAIAPDGSEIYYTVFNEGFDGNIYVIKKQGATWSLPQIAPFSGNKDDLEPAFTPSGDKLFFSSKRNADNYDIYYVERLAGGDWSAPKAVEGDVNTPANEFYPSVAADGTLYYTAKYAHGVGGEDIWFATEDNGTYVDPTPVPAINTQYDEFNAYIDPEQTYIYFGSYGRPDGAGGGDIYYAEKSAGLWKPGVHLGPEINTPALDYCPYVSPDGQYLFFTSQRTPTETFSGTNPFDVEAVMGSQLHPKGASGSDIYWIRREK